MNDLWVDNMTLYAASSDAAMITLMDDFYIDDIIDYIQHTLDIEQVSISHLPMTYIPTISITFSSIRDYMVIQSWFNDLDNLRQK